MELRGFSRVYAREVIEAGLVMVNSKPELRPGRKVSGEAIDILAPDMPYVSRGGYKLAAAIEAFKIDLNGKDCLDAGASTGGFTDCMLQAGAKSVLAVDVGSEQLADKLRNDHRVISVERTDIRDLSIPEPLDFAAADLSFISLRIVIPALKGLIKPGGGLVCLIKPEFETGGMDINKRGVVKSKASRDAACKRVVDKLNECGFAVQGLIPSPITGRDGNEEYLVWSLESGT
jgi:23S rRNA (cytidine1920-2'-O)/16S rRNA (cytidine1409-2'-O)-methyltransferase